MEGKSCVELESPIQEQKVVDELEERLKKLQELPIEELQQILSVDKLRQCVFDYEKIFIEELNELLKIKLNSIDECNQIDQRIDERINAIYNILCKVNECRAL